MIISNFNNPSSNFAAPTVATYQDLSGVALDIATVAFPAVTDFLWPPPVTAPPAGSTATAVTASVGVAVGASVGGVMCVVLLAAAVWRWRQYISQVHSCSTLVRGFVPCS